MAPLITNARVTRRTYQVSVDVHGADPVEGFHKRPVVPDRVTITYYWGHEYGSRDPEDGEWEVRVEYDGYMFKPSGEPGKQRVTNADGGWWAEPTSSYLGSLDWVIDLVEQHRPQQAPVRELDSRG